MDSLKGHVRNNRKKRRGETRAPTSPNTRNKLISGVNRAIYKANSGRQRAVKQIMVGS